MSRILMITPSYNPRLGGVEKHVWQISKELKKRSWQIDILTQHFDNLATEESKQGIKIHRFSFPQRRFFGLLSIWWTLITRYRKLISQADIVHIHDVFIWYLPLRLIFWRKPIITTFHGWEGVFPVPRKNILIRQLANWLSHKTVAIGKYVEKYYQVKTDKVIYGAVELPKSLPKKELLLIYIGRLDYDTGLPVLLQALQKKSWTGKVIFCGDGLLRDQAELVGQVKGFVDPRPYLKRAKVVFAGGYLSILEAFAYQCLVIAAEKNQLKKDYYLLSPFISWMYLVNNEQDLTRHLKRLNNDSMKTNRMLKRAGEWVKSQTWEAVTDQYEKIYRVLK